MTNLTSQSDNIIREAGRSLVDQRAGGRRGNSVGRASATMKLAHTGRKLRNVVLAVGAIVVGAAVLGTVIGGLGPMGLLAVGALAVGAAGMLLKYPALKVPALADLNTPDVRHLVGRTELWLEAQRPALPPPAVKLVNAIGGQLDELQFQLQQVDSMHPTAVQIRKLVGEDLPAMIDGFRRIPERLRHEEARGTTPARQLEEGLTVIGREIDAINRHLAQGSLDDLAIRTRYLDYKYGDATELPTAALADTGKDI